MIKPGLLALESALGNLIASLLAFPDLSCPTSRDQRLLAEPGRALVRNYRPAGDLAGLTHEPEQLIRRIEAVTAGHNAWSGRSPGYADQILDEAPKPMCDDLRDSLTRRS